jgi:type IV pilus assembly protein PilN
MIRINLLAKERTRTKAKVAFDVGQKLTVACSLILLAALLLVGWRYWSLKRESARVDAEIVAAQREAERLRTIIEQANQFEERKGQLERRVVLIEQLRRQQIGPVHMLDQISRALPPMLWLTEVKQANATPDVVIEGRCTALTSLSDFVSNLERSGYFKKSVEIVSTTTENVPPRGELIKFSIKAVFHMPGEPAPAPPANPAKGHS